MALGKLWVIAFRDLGRNRRRSLFTLIAVALGLALLMILNGFVAGVWDDALQNSIHLQTGHVQLRAPTYEEGKRSLLWEDLLTEPEALTQQADALPQVRTATPVLWITGILNTADDTVGLRIFGIRPDSDFYAPIQDAMVSGAYLAGDDRDGILMGRKLADSLGLDVGRRVSLTVVDGDGRPAEGIFTVRGTFSTGVVTYDESAIFMPLDVAQGFTRTGDRASAVILMLNRQEDADQVAAALAGPDVAAHTWSRMNQLLIQAVETGMSFYVILDAIVMLVVAVVIANTLLMAVFERVRELGVLAALGMKRRQIMLMILLEAVVLGVAGMVVGIALGSAGVGYLATVGFDAGEIATAAEGMALSSVMYAKFVPGTFTSLALWTLGVILVVSLYPAWYAARLEPVEALHAL